MVIENIPAKSISYGSKRQLSSITAIVIHYTGNTGDTAVSNGKYFKNTNTRAAGAHYFVDQKGNVVQSINIAYIAYSVGGSKYSDCGISGGGKYYGKYKNANTVSIELCDIVDKYPSSKMIKAVKNLIAIIRKSCVNAKTVVRHFDINGKHCPASMMGNFALNWHKFLYDIGECGSTNVIKPSTTAQISANTAVKESKPTNTQVDREEYKMPQIQKGSKGKAVKVWQIILGFDKNDVDGIFGPHTELKTIEYQAKNDLKKDGIVGSKTWKVGLDSLWVAV